MFAPPVAAAVYCALIGAAFVALWLYYDRRDHARFEGDRRRTSFHCIRCDFIYSAREGAELCKCPRCGQENSRLRF